MNTLSRLKLNWYDDRDTKRLIAAGEYDFINRPEAILDLGAHKGFATEHFAQKHLCPIHAYEPNPKLYKKLVARTRKYPTVTVFNEAIAGHDGTTEFVIAERNVSSSIFAKGKKISVPCVSLATAVARLKTASASVKMDIEGAEFEALRVIPEAVVEIVGEVHPEKARRTEDELSKLLSRFPHVTIGEGKSIFHAV